MTELDMDLIMGSHLYENTMAYYEAKGEEVSKLMHQVWDLTPWMLDVHEGPIPNMRYLEMIKWCHERWGKPAWWPSGQPGAWQRGGVTVNGFTWWGFDTLGKMQEFEINWQP